MQTRKEEAQKKIVDQNEKLKDCLKITNETVTISNETNLELHKQGGLYLFNINESNFLKEQMDRINNKLDDVEDDLQKSKWLFRGFFCIENEII